MKTLDFKLRYLLRKVSGRADTPVRVVIEFKGDLSAVGGPGFRPVTTIGEIAAGTVPLNRLRQLKEHPDIIAVEGSSPFKDETKGNLTAIHLLLPATRLRVIPCPAFPSRLPRRDARRPGAPAHIRPCAEPVWPRRTSPA